MLAIFRVLVRELERLAVANLIYQVPDERNVSVRRDVRGHRV